MSETKPLTGLRTFARLMARDLGITVRLRGLKIAAQKKPPTIFLPSLEYAGEEDTRLLLGLALHEAGHLAYTKFSVGRGCRDYLEFSVHNALEDEYIERRLRQKFRGAGEMLEAAHEEGYRRTLDKGHAEASPTLFSLPGKNSFLAPESRDEVLAVMRRTGLDVDNADLANTVARRLEFGRALCLFLYDSRDGSDTDTRRAWREHPWRKTFDEITNPKARCTQKTLEQAKELIKRLNIKPCMPGDHRWELVEVEGKLSAESKAKQDEAGRAKSVLRIAIRESRVAIARLLADSPEALEVRAAASRLSEAKAVLKAARETLGRCRDECRAIATMLAATRDRLADARAALKASKEAGDVERTRRLERLVGRLEERAGRLAGRLAAARVRTSVARQAVNEAQEKVKTLREQLRTARSALSSVWLALVNERRAETERLRAEMKAKMEEAEKAEKEAKKAKVELEERDEEASRTLPEEVIKELLREILERTKGEPVRPPAPGSSSILPRQATARPPRPYRPAPARRYVPYTTEDDEEVKVVAISASEAEYRDACRRNAALTAEALRRLARLRPPARTAMRMNAESGRLDPRKIGRVGMALRGVPVELGRIWRDFPIRRLDTRFAVSLLLDCSGSMAGPKTKLAREAATCLSEVLAELGIPFEVLGHSTDTSGAEGWIKEMEPEDREGFSRVVPFRGFVYKPFADPARPANVFTDVPQQDNLDGEAVSWAAARLMARPEKVKVLLVLSDGLPSASYSDQAELERHLREICAELEKKENDGFFLIGLGIAEERVKAFYRNSWVLRKIEDLPDTCLRLVEHALGTATNRNADKLDPPRTEDEKPGRDEEEEELEEEESLLAFQGRHTPSASPRMGPIKRMVASGGHR